jgi:hypothetical protein
MKYGLHIVHTKYLHKWGGLVVKGLNSILKIQGSNDTNDIWILTEYFVLFRLPKLNVYLNETYVGRLNNLFNHLN